MDNTSIYLAGIKKGIDIADGLAKDSRTLLDLRNKLKTSGTLLAGVIVGEIQKPEKTT
jgi:hypothetical protein